MSLASEQAQKDALIAYLRDEVLCTSSDPLTHKVANRPPRRKLLDSPSALILVVFYLQLREKNRTIGLLEHKVRRQAKIPKCTPCYARVGI